MKHILKIHAFSFKKIVDGSKTIDIRLFNEKHQLIRPNDIIEFVCDELNERILCLVKAFLVFDTADNMIDVLPPSLFGYPNREEIKVRVRRLFSIDDQLKYNVMGIIIDCLDKKCHIQKREANSLEEESSANLHEYGEVYRPVAKPLQNQHHFEPKLTAELEQEILEKSGRE